MWKTIKYSKKERPLIDVNEQGRFYSYQTRNLIKLKKNRTDHPYLCWTAGGKTKYAHIEVAKAFPEICGEWFDGCVVHHKDGNSLNNEASNLIVCTKEQHLLFHEQLRNEKKEKKVYRPFSEKIIQIDKEEKYSIRYYCRISKKSKDGLSPIEESYYQKGKRIFHNTEFRCNPYDFKQGKYPNGFIQYKINNTL